MNVNIDEKEQLINNTCMLFMRFFPDIDNSTVRNILYMALTDYAVQKVTGELVLYEGDKNEQLIRRFLVTKRVNGLTERTLRYYNTCLLFFFGRMKKIATEVTTNDIRIYFAGRELKDHVSATTRNNERRVLSSFYQWMNDEELTNYNPLRKLPQIKGRKEKKKAFNDMEIEEIRTHCRNEKEKAIVEILLSTGCRVSELAGIRVSEMEEDRVLVHGKGQKDRTCYLNAKAQIAVKQYMETKYFKVRYEAGNPYLFAAERYNTEQFRYQHIGVSGIEGMVRSIGRNAGVQNVHPHRFRRTCATLALRRGMPIEQVSKMLGHESIETTQIYLDLTEDDLRQAHKKYVI